MIEREARASPPGGAVQEASMSSTGPITAVMVHVQDWRAAIAWYELAFPGAKRIGMPDMDWACLLVDGVSIELVNADAKVAAGTAGTVVYWSTHDFDARRAQLEQLGALLYRGPMKIESELWMAQLRDPFGNLIGIRGPRVTT
jgi:predicted enzyme related to lactoylglutathione lyase